MPDLDLDRRAGLPDALRVLLEEYPRAGWADDPGFDGLVRFWLERHLMFRRLLDTLRTDATGALEREIAPDTHAARLGRLGGVFVNDLQMHHGIEDQHFFPVLSKRDARIARGFEMLDADHHAIDAHLDRFVSAANDLLQGLREDGARDRLAGVLRNLERLERLLDRHLTDEEDLIVPVILKYGTDGLPH